MSFPKDYRDARKDHPWLKGNKQKQKMTKKIPKGQKFMHDYIKWAPLLSGKYLYRFPKIKQTCYEDFAEGKISKKEWDMFRSLLGVFRQFSPII